MTTVAMALATYNEIDTIDALLAGLAPYAVFLVDDNSPDGTGMRALDYPRVTLISRPGKQGIASAYALALHRALASGAEYIVQMDAGGTHDPRVVPQLVQAARQHRAGLVIGSRFRGPAPFRGGRTLLSRGAAFLCRLLGLADVRDATSGYRCWRRDVLAQVLQRPLRAQGFAFQLELLARAARTGPAIVEVGIPYVLTNSSLRWGMLLEALRIVWQERWRGARHIHDS